jgi:predicted MFS family arabinose efflux permease
MAIVFGTWLIREYGLTTAQIGLVAMVLGLSELTGSVLVSLVGDRLGKYRTVRASTAATVIAYSLLPFLNVGLTMVIIGLIVWRFTFEVAMVANISLLSEQIPTQRAKVLTLGSAAVTVGAAMASISGPFAYSTWGVYGVAFISAGASLAATILVLNRVSER